MERNNKNSSAANKWYKEFPHAAKGCKHSKTDNEVLELKEQASTYLRAETMAYNNKQEKSKDSETAWLRTALKKGTTSDKIAASVVFIQDNPKYNLSKLESLISQVKVAKHNQCSLVIDALKDLFLTDLLHPKFKLLNFDEQDLDVIDNTEQLEKMKSGATKRSVLIHYYFEEKLKEQYSNFISMLSKVASDTVEVNREKAISIMTELLIQNGEQEQKLLEYIVNKVGDPTSKVASKTVFCLIKLLHEHPNMKMVVLKEIEKLLFRNNVAKKAQYYAICLLTQFVLDKTDEEVASKLLNVYFAFFTACVKRGEPESRLMAAILTGVNRAYPFGKPDSEELEKNINIIYQIVYLNSFNVSLNALCLLFQASNKQPSQQNRFYTAFYKKITDPQIGTANKHGMFLNLLYRALKNDPSLIRLHAYLKRVLHNALYYPANMTCALLYVISRVIQNRKDLREIIFSSNKCEVKKELPQEKNEEQDTELVDLENESDVKEVKHKESVDIITNIVKEEQTAKIKNDKNSSIHDENCVKTEDVKPDISKEYDPFARNPLYVNALKYPMSELEALKRHFHPSVSLFAQTILEGKPINYTGDPLEDLTSIRFLDRYVFKNPKKLEDKKIVKKNDPLSRRAGYKPKGLKSLPVDSMAYLNEKEERIPVDELYLYKYLKQKKLATVKNPRDDDDDNDDLDSVNSDEFNEMLDRLGDGNDVVQLDIASDIGTAKKCKSGDADTDDLLEDDKGADGSINEDDIETGDEDNDSEIEGDEDSDNKFEDEDLDDFDEELEGIDDEDMSDMDFDESNDEDEQFKSSKSSKSSQPGKLKKFKGIDENIFVSAEKFAEMLEEQGKTKKGGSSHTLSDLDGASSKQLEWESNRNYRIKGKRKQSKSFNNKNFKKSKRF